MMRNDNEHSELVGHHLLDSPMDYPTSCYIYPYITKRADIQRMSANACLQTDVCKRTSITGYNKA
jgi:hypothetical protein